MRKDRAVMLGILLIAISIGTVATVMPVVNFTIPLTALESEPIISESIPETPKVSSPGYEGAGVGGWVIIEVYDKAGNLKHYTEDHNLIVDEGTQSTSDLLFGTTFTTGESAGEFTFIQLGTGTVDPDEADTNCGTPAGSKIDDTAVVNHPSLVGAILNATGTFGNQLVGLSISEICLTDNTANATGNLFARQEFTPFVFNDGDSVNATWTISIIDSDGS